HAGAELVFANYCATAGLTEGVSALAVTDCTNATLRARAKAAAVAASRAVYRYDATLGEKRDDAPKLKKIVLWVARNQATEAQHGLREGRAIGNGMNLTRLLGDLPPNVCTPT